MNTRLANTCRICSYGSTNTLWFVTKRANMHDPSRWTKKNEAGAITDYVIEGVHYSYVTSLKDYDVVKCPDRTYAKVDRKKKTLLGPLF